MDWGWNMLMKYKGTLGTGRRKVKGAVILAGLNQDKRCLGSGAGPMFCSGPHQTLQGLNALFQCPPADPITYFPPVLVEVIADRPYQDHSQGTASSQ